MICFVSHDDRVSRDLVSNKEGSLDRIPLYYFWFSKLMSKL